MVVAGDSEVVVVVDSLLEGALEGTEDGDFVGVLVGLVDRFVEGADVGDCEGELVESGANVEDNGSSVVVVGSPGSVGFLVGTRVGRTVGEEVGGSV